MILMLLVNDDAVSTTEPAGSVCASGPDTLPTSAGETPAREAPQPAVLRHRTVHQALRGKYLTICVLVVFYSDSFCCCC